MSHNNTLSLGKVAGGNSLAAQNDEPELPQTKRGQHRIAAMPTWPAFPGERELRELQVAKNRLDPLLPRLYD